MNKKLRLCDICLLYNTDKNIMHSYIDEVYESLFKKRRKSTQNFLEIGVENGGSLLMWREYFKTAKITGIDIKPCPQVENKKRVEMIVGNAYCYDTLNKVRSDFDVIIDDGPHTLESITFVALEYSKKIKNDGVLIIEDFQDFNWTNIIKRIIPKEFKVEVKDLRLKKNRYDDILMIISKA